MALISFHLGTIHDFQYIGERLDLDITLSAGVRGYNLTRKDALQVWDSLGEMYCSHFDAIVVIDTVASGGRPFMEAFTQLPGATASCRTRTIIMLVTNRFDYKLYGSSEYYDTVQKSLKVNRIKWAQVRAGGMLLTRSLKHCESVRCCIRGFCCHPVAEQSLRAILHGAPQHQI